jgi:hypothetical protein
MANVQVFGAVVVLGGGLVLAAVSLVSYQRLRNIRALLIGLGFLGMAAKGGFLLWSAWQSGGSATWVLPMALLDMWVLIAFYTAMRKR